MLEEKYLFLELSEELFIIRTDGKRKSKMKFSCSECLLNFSNMLICPVMEYKIPIGSVMAL